jgi:hypothetical protein
LSPSARDDADDVGLLHDNEVLAFAAVTRSRNARNFTQPFPGSQASFDPKGHRAADGVRRNACSAVPLIWGAADWAQSRLCAATGF